MIGLEDYTELGAKVHLLGRHIAFGSKLTHEDDCFVLTDETGYEVIRASTMKDIIIQMPEERIQSCMIRGAKEFKKIIMSND